MKVVSVINYKGGVGKTTLTANLGAYAAMKGFRVLLIDLDPQTHLTFSFMTPEHWRDKYKDHKTMRNYFYSLIEGKDRTSLLSLIVPLELEQCRKFHILCSSLEMADLDIGMAGKCLGTDFSTVAVNSLMVYNYLRAGLEEIKGEYDLVLIDCPPNCNATVRSALTASDYYLIPARLDYLSSLGIEFLNKSILKFLKDYREYTEARPDLGYKHIAFKCLGIVPMMVNMRGEDPQKVQQEYMKKLQENMNRLGGGYMFHYVRQNNEMFGKELKDKKGNVVPAVLAHLRADATKLRVRGELKQLGEEFLKRIAI